MNEMFFQIPSSWPLFELVFLASMIHGPVESGLEKPLGEAVGIIVRKMKLGVCLDIGKGLGNVKIS
jgi:hypothetical protein